MTKRLVYYDFLRGVAILMVVAIHTFGAGGGFDTPEAVVRTLVRQMVGCAVPVFLAISGFFLARKALDTWEERRSFWKKQIPKIYVPMLLWSIPFFALSLYHAVAPFSGYAVFKAVFLWVFGGCSIYYFIALIIQCYLLLPWIRNVKIGGGNS